MRFGLHGSSSCARITNVESVETYTFMTDICVARRTSIVPVPGGGFPSLRLHWQELPLSIGPIILEKIWVYYVKSYLEFASAVLFALELAGILCKGQDGCAFEPSDTKLYQIPISYIRAGQARSESKISPQRAGILMELAKSADHDAGHYGGFFTCI